MREGLGTGWGCKQGRNKSGRYRDKQRHLNVIDAQRIPEGIPHNESNRRGDHGGDGTSLIEPPPV